MTWFRSRPRAPKFESKYPHRNVSTQVEDPEVVAAIAREFRRMQERPAPVSTNKDSNGKTD
jgi:hypothetical protein